MLYQALEFLIASNKKGLNDQVKDFDNGKLECKKIKM